MRKYIILSSLVFLPAVISAQGKIRYTYDSAGNRIKRETFVSSAQRAKASQQTTTPGDLGASGILSDHAVTIYTNPTNGLLRVYISGLRGIDKCSLYIYTSQGALVLAHDVRTDKTDLDISNQASGIYLLKIIINDKSTTWKVIKK